MSCMPPLPPSLFLPSPSLALYYHLAWQPQGAPAAVATRWRHSRDVNHMRSGVVHANGCMYVRIASSPINTPYLPVSCRESIPRVTSCYAGLFCVFDTSSTYSHTVPDKHGRVCWDCRQWRCTWQLEESYQDGWQGLPQVENQVFSF